MLIVGFNNTLHNPNFISPENTFAVEEVDKMADKISEALESADKMRELVDQQRVNAGDTTIEEYHKVIGDLENE